MRCRGEADAPLSAGMAFMANPDAFNTHLHSGQEYGQVCGIILYVPWLMLEKPSTCNTYKAIEQANSSRPHLDVTGIGATACCHGFFVPTSVVDFQKGERCVQPTVQLHAAYLYHDLNQTTQHGL